jgi:hypothetical protein
MANPTSTIILRPAVSLLLSGVLLACSGSGSEQAQAISRPTETVSADVPTSFVGSWILDVPKRTPPALEPDHYERTEYEIRTDGGQPTGPAIWLTKWTAALAMENREQWFRTKLSGPLSCTYIPDRQCLACGPPKQFIQDSLFIDGSNLINTSPGAANGSASGQLVLTRQP